MEQSKRKQGRRNISIVVPYPLAECRKRLEKNISGTVLEGSGERLTVRLYKKNKQRHFSIRDDGRLGYAIADCVLESVDSQSTHIRFTVMPDGGIACISYPLILLLVFMSLAANVNTVGKICIELPMIVCLGGASIIFWEQNLRFTYKLKKRMMTLFDIEPGIKEPTSHPLVRTFLFVASTLATVIIRFKFGMLDPSLSCLITAVYGLCLAAILIQIYRAF
jgi:hypothetical protein